MDGKLWTTFILSEAAGHDKVNSRNHHTRRLLGPSFRFVPDKSESGHRIGRDDGAVFVSTKEALTYRVAIRVNIIPCCGGSHAWPSSGLRLSWLSQTGLARSLCSQECSMIRTGLNRVAAGATQRVLCPLTGVSNLTGLYRATIVPSSIWHYIN